MSLTEAEKQLIRDRIRGWEIGEEESARIRAGEAVPSPPEALNQAFALWSANPAGRRSARSAVEEEELEQVRATWARLRARFAR